MGDPTELSDTERAETRGHAASIIESVTADTRMPLGISDKARAGIWPGTLDTIEYQMLRLAQEVSALKAERDDARMIARVIAHSYTHDSRPPEALVLAALAFPVIRENP